MMRTFNEACASEEDFKVLSRMEVIGISDCKTSDDVEGVTIDFEGKSGEKRSLLVLESGQISISQPQYPVFCGQDIRDYEGYRIAFVHGNAVDGVDDLYIKLVNDHGGEALIFIKDSVFDGESMHIQDAARGIK